MFRHEVRILRGMHDAIDRAGHRTADETKTAATLIVAAISSGNILQFSVSLARQFIPEQ